MMFHGNGYHIWHHLGVGKEFVKLGCAAIMVSYRGYGNSTGYPTERGLRRDAQAALDYILGHTGLSKVPIVVHGHSLGGAVSIDLAARNPGKISALIVENTFLSIPSVARSIPLFRHLTFFIHQRWQSEKRIKQIERSVPICMMSGAKDGIVPAEQMGELHRLSINRSLKTKGKQKDAQSMELQSTTDEDGDDLKDEFHVFERGDHADTWTQEGYWLAIDSFLTSVIGL